MTDWHPQWPVLTRYEGERLRCVAMPLGGIGTGTVSLGGRGNLQDWEIMNRPAKGFNGGEAVFVLWAQEEGQPAVTRALEGVLLPPYEGASGAKAPYHGLPRFRKCVFAAAYPLAQVLLEDPDVPLTVRLEAFNPLVPAEPETSGLPVAVLRYVLRNRSARPVRATVCGNVKNFIGSDGKEGKPAANVNTFREGSSVRGLFLSSSGVDKMAPQWGTMAFVTTAPQASYRRSWASETWNGALLHFWDDLSEDGRLDDPPESQQDAPMASLAVPVEIPPQGEATVTFLLTWHFPNRQTWTPRKGEQASAGSGGCGCAGGCCGDPNRVGNYYTTLYADAWQVAEAVAPRLAALEEATCTFVDAFCGSDLPAVVKEAALYNLSTLRSQTCFRTEDGRFFGWEGCNDDTGCCYGSCTHVWNYEQATAFLFGDLARSMRETEFLHATAENGLMSFRVYLPLERAQEFGKAAADGQMGCIMKAYREWQLSGDDAFLQRLWPKVKAALAFCWIPGGWDADQDGVMEGCQHNTLDVEYYGPNPLMGAWYLGALRAAEEMARHLGDTEFAERCHCLFTQGSRWLDEHLFNGEYYEQIVMPPKEGQLIAEGLQIGAGAKDLRDPDYQVGPGCLVDQLVGQYMAHICGLGYLLDPQHVRRTLASILRYNFQENLYRHFNHLRTFALNDEQAMLMCTFPRGGRPKTPVPYFNEVMTGFEYSTAAHMIYEGQVQEGLRCIAAIRARYDGARRNPFDEAECGHHYGRAMASWAAVLALTGFHYSGVERSMTFAPMEGRHFWSTGYAWGTCEIARQGGDAEIKLTVLHGRLVLQRFRLAELGQKDWERPQTLTRGQELAFRVQGRLDN